MQCISSHPLQAADLLTDRTLAVQHLVGQRSLLPPAPSAEQLLHVLREAGHPSTAPPANQSGGATANLLFPPDSFAPDHILRQCPTSRRVTSSFAAAGAHSLLGEMLQFFAESLTRLFTAGVADPAVCAFPSEWERRLHAPAAASMRQHHLYELQGFSALYTFVWAQVATSLSLAREPTAEPPDEPAAATLRSASAGRTAAARNASPKGTRAQLAVARLPLLTDVSPAQTQRQPPPPLLVPVQHSSTTKPRFVSGSASARICVPMTSADLCLPGTEGVASAPVSGAKTVASLAGLWTRPVAPPPALAVLQHALTAQAKSQGPFLPSIPAEGIVPSSAIRDSGASAQEGTVGSTGSSGGARPPAALPSAPSSAREARPSPALSVEQAMQQDRHRELRRKMGVRRVRNYAEENDMRGYLDDYQSNLQSVLDEDDGADASPPTRAR